VDVRAFTRNDVITVAPLLVQRGNRHPLAAPVDAVAEIEALLDDGHTGYVAPGGYLIGRVEEDAAWTYFAGHAARDEATYRHLYAAISRDWVAAGQRRHCVAMPEGDPVAERAFANLAFGREHVFALASLADQPSGCGRCSGSCPTTSPDRPRGRRGRRRSTTRSTRGTARTWPRRT
jgi:hypothetical protein